MKVTIWLASYPKSGNTWFRMMIGAVFMSGSADRDINSLPAMTSIASDRVRFDDDMLLDSGILTHDEVDCLRPRVYERIAEIEENGDERSEWTGPVRFIKVHDAYTLTANGEPLLAGSRAAAGAIVIVRDPRDVVPSLANHNGITIDAAISRLNNPDSATGGRSDRQSPQLRQRLLTWSQHVASWLDQTDIPVHLIRYEDLRAEPAVVFGQAMTFAGVSVDEAARARAVAMTDFSQLQQQEKAVGFREASGPRKDRTFFRRGQAGGWREELTVDQIDRIESAHAPMMLRLGYEPVGKSR